MIRHIPNCITLGNLFCGCAAIVYSVYGNMVFASYLVGVAVLLDFMDGFVARLLKVNSDIGKQLDSLADVVTFGVVPGIQVMELSRNFLIYEGKTLLGITAFIPFLGFIIPLLSAYRLAKFNVDTRQSDRFIGLPTPANALFFCSIPLIIQYDFHYTAADFELHKSLINSTSILVAAVVMSVLLISEIPLFALKFKSFGWEGNEIRYVFLVLSAMLLIIFGVVGMPLIIILYLLLSVGINLFKRKTI